VHRDKVPCGIWSFVNNQFLKLSCKSRSANIDERSALNLFSNFDESEGYAMLWMFIFPILGLNGMNTLSQVSVFLESLVTADEFISVFPGALRNTWWSRE